VQSKRPAFGIWLTGLPASGKSTVATELSKRILQLGINVIVLESDALRRIFPTPPRYDEQDREYFYSSLAFIGRVLIDHGISVIFDATANRRAYRDRARQNIERFLEIYVDCPLETCMRRDPKGIYGKARRGEISNVPGIQTVYEPPENPDLVIRRDRDDPVDAAQRIISLLIQKGYDQASVL